MPHPPTPPTTPPHPPSTPVPAPQPGETVAGLTLRPVPPDSPDRQRALAVLLTGRDAPHDRAVAAFVAYTDDAKLDAHRLWAGFDGPTPQARPAAAVLALPGPGRTAMVLISPTRTPQYVPACAAMCAAVVEALPDDTHLVQCLLELDQLYEQTALTTAGLHVLARLMYLQRAIDPQESHRTKTELPGEALPPVLVPDAQVTLHPWAQQHRELFAQAILGSYEDTQDCPALVGARHIDDIFAGHRGTGTFTPDLWTLALVDDQPAAVLLLATLPGRDAVELVYLGVTKAMRGRGLGQQLLHRGIAQAAQTNTTQMLLAVDEQNTPARALYQRHGFRLQSRRSALVRFLKT